MLDQILKSGPSSRTSTTHALPHPDDRSSRPSDFPKPILRRASTSSVASSLRSPPHPRGISNDERIDPGLLEASLASRPRSKLLLQSPTATSTPTPEREKEKDETTRQSSPNRAPWRRRDGWRGWATESVGTSEMVPALVVQAFSTGILDATTYADFNTFASNRAYRSLAPGKRRSDRC